MHPSRTSTDWAQHGTTSKRNSIVAKVKTKCKTPNVAVPDAQTSRKSSTPYAPVTDALTYRQSVREDVPICSIQSDPKRAPRPRIGVCYEITFGRLKAESGSHDYIVEKSEDTRDDGGPVVLPRIRGLTASTVDGHLRVDEYEMFYTDDEADAETTGMNDEKALGAADSDLDMAET